VQSERGTIRCRAQHRRGTKAQFVSVHAAQPLEQASAFTDAPAD
jgi:hypothetical protein